MNVDFERAFLAGWQSVTNKNVPQQVAVDALDGCRNTSEAKFLGREYAKDFELEQTIQLSGQGLRLQAYAKPLLQRAEAL